MFNIPLVGRRKEEGGRRKEEGERRKEEGGRKQVVESSAALD